MNKAKLFGKILFYIFFFAVLLLVVGLLFSKINNRVFFLGNRSTLWVMTDSMEDQIPARSYILIRKADPSEIQVGDVITYYSDDPVLQGHLNTHRVVEIQDGGRTFITKGDANLVNDKYPARADAVVGVYEKNLDFLSTLGRWFQSPMGLICIFALLAVVLLFTYCSDFMKKIFKGKSKEEGADSNN
jgi:signal peptidase